MSVATARPLSRREEHWLRLLLHGFSRFNLFVYRQSRGRLLSRWQGRPCIGVLTCRGRKTGALRSTPLLYLRDAERLVLIASNAGMSRDPLWYQNLVVNPDCEFEIDAAKYAMRARTANADEERHYFPRLVGVYADFVRYRERAGRDLPIVILEPRVAQTASRY